MLPKLAHWSGYASILGGLLFGVAIVLHPLRDGISVLNSGDAYGAIHFLGAYGLMFQLLGLVGLYIREAEVIGQRGLRSFIAVFFGQILYICVLVGDGIMNPLLAKYAPELVHSTSTAHAQADPGLLIALPALGLFFLGYILFGASLLRAKVQSRLGSLLMTFGAPLYIVGGLSLLAMGPASPIVSLIERAGAIPLGLGYILLGFSVRSGANLQVGQPSNSSS
jgi:hypothetical protein